MKVNWEQLCSNSEVLPGDNWREAGEAERKTLRLSPRFRFLRAEDPAGILGAVVAEERAREEDMLSEGLVWAGQISAGGEARLFFLAPLFSRSFLTALGGVAARLRPQAILWREKLPPCFFPVASGTSLEPAPFFAGRRADWENWAARCNPVARRQLAAVSAYFETLAARRVRALFHRNSIAFAWGGVEIAEITAAGDKFDLRTKNKGLKKVVPARQGWVDADGRLDEGFRRTVQSALSWLEEREAAGRLPPARVWALQMWHEPGFIRAETGRPLQFPLLKKENGGLQPGDFWYFAGPERLSVYYPVLARPWECPGQVLYYSAVLEENAEEISRLTGDAVWDGKIHLVAPPELSEKLERLRDCFREGDRFPLVLLPEKS
ncbi:MAG: hypothetical protein LBS10_01370 [Gracilibacteraceae bacterium]|nr:hypothetical protein [Gracilibacteraceae bacterium]